MTIKEAKKCATCNGNGQYTTLEAISATEPHLNAPVGLVECENCGGSGQEQDEEIVLERLLNDLSSEQEEKLEISFGENNGELMFNKDNFEDFFENWLSKLSLGELEEILK